MTDADFMKLALAAAEPGRGRTAFAPSIGCVIVKDGKVVASARTSDGGVPHAEASALASLASARGATAYVTLEPCAAPDPGAATCCTDLLIAAGVARVVMATLDPDHKTNGKGLEKLRSAGVICETGLMETESRRQNLEFYESRGVEVA
jgi:diaminohydroxyphosphoribosylaminopyrimidine deaminase/5-amino-6-(5-phosphoribosylamino)uracil reductase